MKVVFDTSVVVAGSIARHVHEARAAAWFTAAREGRISAAVTSHTLAETWATMTALPIQPAVPPALIDRVIERFRSHIELLELSWSDYTAAMRRCSDRGLRSGVIYDALHLAAAERWRADVFLSFNLADFARMSTESGPVIAAPPDPPGLDIAAHKAAGR
ncbi:MAG: type II toxin-antitoxin system VapC family toxin [Longimicrobiales bacterium]